MSQQAGGRAEDVSLENLTKRLQQLIREIPVIYPLPEPKIRIDSSGNLIVHTKDASGIEWQHLLKPDEVCLIVKALHEARCVPETLMEVLERIFAKPEIKEPAKRRLHL